MILYKPENCTDDSQTVYYCDSCGNWTSFSDHWWPGHYHWEELNYTLCLDCLSRHGLPTGLPVPHRADTSTHP